MTIPLREARGEEVSNAELDTGGPQHVAPVVTWLATEAAASISGQIIHCASGLVGIMQQPAIIKSFQKSEIWSLDELDARMPELIEAKQANDEAARGAGAASSV